jgi:GntR family transcriptional regulator/MocR family aminotransferase
MSPSPIASVGARTRYDLRPGTPDLAAFPRAGWLAAARRALSAAPFEALGYDRHVRRSRLAYRRRRDRLLAALRQAVPDVSVTGIAAGLHALVQLRDDDDEDDVITRALEHGLSLEGLGAYLEAPSRHPPALVVGYGTPPEHAFTAAIARLCAVLAAGA